MQPICRSVWRIWQGRASILPNDDPQGRCRLAAVAIKFTDVYGNIWERLFESEYLPKDRTAGLHLLYSPDNRLAEFCQPKGVIPE